MKKIILTACAGCALVLSATAQQQGVSMVRTDGTSVGIHAGVNMFNINGKNASGTELDNKLKTGFSAGVNVAVPLGSGFYVQPGVDFTQKGTETESGIKTTLNYIDIPVNFVYKPILGTGNMVLGFGPYLGFGVSGKVKNANGTTSDVEFKDEYDGTLPATTTQLRRADAGANFLAGYEFANKLSVNLKAQLGLKDINPDVPNDNNNQTRFRNTGFGLSLGYRF
ncbi:MAG TPA: porin family protein [Flavisolibacter sp.]|jgi:hypothetical protein|nr:porin family protein [Flavisolibacter sp.]